MALSGIQIYKLLPQTNCKDCGFPTCLAFAMKLSAKQVELALCPHVSEEAQSELAASSEPPVRLVTLSANGNQVKAGNEVVLFRHEKTFYHRPGLFVRVQDNMAPETLAETASGAEAYMVDYVGQELALDGLAIESITGDADAFAAAVRAVRAKSQKPFILISEDPAVMAAGLRTIDGEAPLIYAANEENWEEMAALAKQHEAPLAVRHDTLEGLADLSKKIKEEGVKDLVLDPDAETLGPVLVQNTAIRRKALKENYRPFGYPIISLPARASSAAEEAMLAAQAIAKYAGFVVLNSFKPAMAYPLLVLRENIYTDPQKPIQVQPGLYEINEPGPNDPVLVTTNFSITYFSVANEVEGAGAPAWLLVTDAEGMSVLTAWAAGHFDAERIAKDAARFELAEKVAARKMVIPGHVAVISGELEEEMPGWQITVGPREAVDLPAFIKQVLNPG